MKVSVVMGVYNGFETLEETVSSILMQSFENIELIIVNDGSNRETKTLIDHLSMRDDRIIILHKEKNEGLTKSLIAGCNIARGLYIARIDNGDLMVPQDRLRIQSETLDADPDLVLVGGGMDIIDLLNRDIYRSLDFPLEDWEIRQRIKNSSVFAHVTVMFRKITYHQCGGYNPSCYTGQDTELWPRLLREGKGKILDQVFAIAPMKSDSISVKNNRRQILGKIGREWQKIRARQLPFFRVTTILLHALKLFIPTKLRVRLRYRKNYRYLGKVQENDYVLRPKL